MAETAGTQKFNCSETGGQEVLRSLGGKRLLEMFLKSVCVRENLNLTIRKKHHHWDNFIRFFPAVCYSI